MQWYENVPAVWNVWEKRSPGATAPEFHSAPSDVEVWETESVFIHVTVVPAATFRSSGMYALFPKMAASEGIATDEDGPPGVGDGVGDVEGDGLPLPQAIANIKTTETTARRNEIIGSSTLA